MGVVLSAFVLSLPLNATTDDSAKDLLRQSQAAWEAGQREKALELADKAVAAAPKNPVGYYVRGGMRDLAGKHAEAVADLDRCLELDPKLAHAYDLRGSAQFKLAKFKESLADFDRFLELRPREGPGHWRRGITLYYAGRFEDGCKQFKGYESVDTNDVENAVWHFLCAAKSDGIAKARKGMLAIGKDRRVPMMEVYDLFLGKIEPADVLKAAQAGEVSEDERQRRLFYAHLYLGLWFDVNNDPKKSLEHITLAAGKYNDGNYMGEVARVHEKVLREQLKAK